MIFPEFWRRFLAEHRLVRLEVEIPAACDLTSIGAVIEILDEDAAASEAHEALPGVGVWADGFVPVGGCGIGTGDPYFINIHDSDNGPLYRISHEDVSLTGYDRAQAVATVLAHYRDLLRFVPRAG
jgi:hypothetical protein